MGEEVGASKHQRTRGCGGLEEEWLIRMLEWWLRDGGSARETSCGDDVSLVRWS